MNSAMRDDFKRDGFTSQLMKRIADLEAFEREFRVKPFGAGGDLVLLDDQSGAAADFTLTFPTGYKALRLMLTLRSDYASDSDYVNYEFNADGGANYAYMLAFLRAAGVAFVSGAAVTGMRQIYCTGATIAANIFSNAESLFYNYEGSTKKTVITTTALINGTAAGNVQRGDASGWWDNTDAITSLRVYPVNGTQFVAGSRVTLYGYS